MEGQHHVQEGVRSPGTLAQADGSCTRTQADADASPSLTSARGERTQFFIETLRKDVVVVEEHRLEKLSQGGLVEVRRVALLHVHVSMAMTGAKRWLCAAAQTALGND